MTVQASIQEHNNPKERMLLLVVLFIPCLLINQVLDNDIWFLLNNGRYVLQYGIPHFEPFTLHQGMSYVMQQWLSSVIFWMTYKTLGSLGLTVLLFIIDITLIYTAFRLSMRISEGNFFVSYIISICFNVLISQFIVQRPYLFMILIITIELYLLESFIRLRKSAYLLFLPLLSVLMINLEAAMWPVLFIILIPYCIDAFEFKLINIKGQGYPKKAFFSSIVVMVLVAFINPYGIEAMTYLFRSYGYKEISDFIREMLVPNINNTSGKIVFGSFFSIVLSYSIYKNGKTRLRYILLTLGTAIMALSSIRSFSIFIVCGFLPLAYFFKDIHLPEQKKGPLKNTKILRKLLILLLCIALGAGVFLKYDQSRKQFDNFTLAGAVNYLLKNTNTKNIVLYTGYNDGGYAEFMGLKPYIDSRADVFVKKNNHKDDIMKEYYLLQIGRVYYRNVLDRYGFTHLIVSKGDRLYTLLPYDKDYIMTYENKDYKVFERIKK